MNHKTKGNDTLRQRLKLFLNKIPSGKEIETNHLVMELSKLNKNYSLNSARVTNLLKENREVVRFIRSGIWLKL
ncbi:MAG: hypothetical protein WC415_01760 [Patescibacteria group bacterium]|jgi:hypothetical protein